MHKGGQDRAGARGGVTPVKRGYNSRERCSEDQPNRGDGLSTGGAEMGQRLTSPWVRVGMNGVVVRRVIVQRGDGLIMLSRRRMAC